MSNYEYEPRFTPRFIKDTKTLKGDLKKRLEKSVLKVLEDPENGKPLIHTLRGLKSMRVGKFRIIYEVRKKEVIFHVFDHREKVYK